MVAQDSNAYSPWDSYYPNQSSTHVSKNTWKIFRDFIFYFSCSVEKQMVSLTSYFRMDLLCLQSLKAAAKGYIYCWVCWFACFKMTHSNDFARALRWRYVPQN